jgi:F0F1-type ATP synthase assembly protein I
MSTISHGPSSVVPERHDWFSRLLVPEMWASLAIVAMWLAVLFTAAWGQNFVSTSAGGDSTTIPSAVIVALFASLATWAVARHGFRRRD